MPADSAVYDSSPFVVPLLNWRSRFWVRKNLKNQQDLIPVSGRFNMPPASVREVEKGSNL